MAELLDDDGPPLAVVIDEAVELVKTYSTDESGSFVNGILSTIAAEVRGDKGAAIRYASDREVSPVRLIRTGGVVAERERSQYATPRGRIRGPLTSSLSAPTCSAP